jgi:hypothetical protein
MRHGSGAGALPRVRFGASCDGRRPFRAHPIGDTVTRGTRGSCGRDSSSGW